MTSLPSGQRGRALIVGDAFARGGLAGARALKADGWEVGIGVPGTGGPLGWSRAVSKQHPVPSPSADPAPFVAAVAEAVRAGGYDVAFATGDAEAIILSAHRDGLGALFPYPRHEAVLASFDKMRLFEAAGAAGLSTPATVRLDERSELGFPYVLKPRTHEALGTSTRIEAAIVSDESEADEAIESAMATELVAQQVIRGTLMAYSVVCDRSGKPVARSQQIADAVYPMPAGVSARARTVPVDEELAGSAHRLLAGLGWFGLAQLQFIVDDSGVPYLIDMNGRFYGSMALAVAAGANLPAAWARLAIGEEVAPVTATPGFVFQWFEGDLRSGLAESRSLRSVAGTVSHSRGAAHSIWSPRDPGPAVRFAGHLGWRVVKKLFSKLGRS